MPNRKFGVDGALLKKIAVITMFIDHFAAAILYDAHTKSGMPLFSAIPHGREIYLLMRGIGRFAFPVFCFMIVVGYLHTKNPGKYMLRLLGFALISEIPFMLALFPNSTGLHCDTMFTLALGMASIWLIDVMADLCFGDKRSFLIRSKSRQRLLDRPEESSGDERREAHAAGDRNFGLYSTSPLWAALVFLGSSLGGVRLACFAADYLSTDYGHGGVITIVILYVLYSQRAVSAIASWAWISYYNSFETWAFPAFILIKCYNGSKGKQSKYFFYIFYPAHLLLLYLIRRVVFGA